MADANMESFDQTSSILRLSQHSVANSVRYLCSWHGICVTSVYIYILMDNTIASHSVSGERTKCRRFNRFLQLVSGGCNNY